MGNAGRIQLRTDRYRNPIRRACDPARGRNREQSANEASSKGDRRTIIRSFSEIRPMLIPVIYGDA